MKHLTYMFFVLLIASASFAQETLVLTTTTWPPYQYEENGQVTGIAVDIVQEAAQKLGYTIEVQLLPWKRALKNAETGEADGVVSALFTEERAQYLYYTSEPLFEVRTVIFAPKDSSVTQLKSLNDLIGKRIGVVSGYSYGEEFDNFSGLQKYACKDDAVLARNLERGRIDVAVAHEFVFKFASRNIGLQDRFKEVYTLSQYPSYLVFSKAPGKKGQPLTEEFNQVLIEMKNSGRIDAIISTYLEAKE